ncbi:MAG: FecR domain-containing protein [Nitrospirales bacterium]
MKETPTSPSPAIHREALRWFLRLRSPDCTPQERQAFERWLTRHQAHGKEYEAAQTVWDQMRVLETNPLPEFEHLLRHRPPHHAPRNPASWVPFTLAVTAIMCLVVGGVWWWQAMQQTVIPYRTAMGEMQTVSLVDGTVMELNSRTSLTVHLSSQERRIDLEEGEVYVTVAHEEERPFIVSTKGGRIYDIGTQFSVHTQEDRVQVAVVEGEVRIELDSKSASETGEQAHYLTAGQRLAYTHAGIWSDVERVDTRLVAAWREGKLVFDGILLSEAIREVKRYWPGQIIIVDDSLAETKVKGNFDLKNLSGFFQALPQILPVQVTHDRAGRMIISRSSDH